MAGEDWESWIEAFKIFALYDSPANRVIGRHDCVYAGPDAREISPEDQARLTALGWHISPDTTSFVRYT